MDIEQKEKMKKDAEAAVATKNPGSKNIRSGEIYENFLGGTLIDVTFQNSDGNKSLNNVHFSKEVTVYRIFRDVCEAVSNYKERRFFSDF